MDLHALFEPRSVAIVGASAEPAKISGMIVDFLLKSGYAGRIFPVNPRYGQIRSLACYPSVESLPERVDLVVCVVPVAVVFESIEAAARMGVPFCLLMSGGFGEGRTGAEGLARHDRLMEICRGTGMHVVGPNTVGMVNFRNQLPLTFADWYARDTGQRGGVAIVTHSGSVGGLIFSSLQASGIGVDYWFGLGNEATLETADFVEHFSRDPDVHTVICYLEGVQNGRKFAQAAAGAHHNGKRVIVIRAGAHPESARSTRSHTGKDPTRADVYEGILRQLGVIEAASLAELAYIMMLLTTAGNRLGRRVGIISASGGACSLIADHVIDAGLELPELPTDLQKALNGPIPEYGSSLNPVDLSADVVARPDILDGALQALHTDDTVDVWLVFGRPIVDRYHQRFIEFARTTSKAVIVSCGVPIAGELQAALRANGVAVLDDPELALRALAQVVRVKGASVQSIDDFSAAPARNRNAMLSGAGAALLLQKSGFAVAGNGVPCLDVTIESDRDFGPVITARTLTSTGASARSVVRALPASPAVLKDAACEVASGEEGLGAYALEIERAMAAVAALYLAQPDGALVSAQFTMFEGRFAVHTPAVAPT